MIRLLFRWLMVRRATKEGYIRNENKRFWYPVHDLNDLKEGDIIRRVSDRWNYSDFKSEKDNIEFYRFISTSYEDRFIDVRSFWFTPSISFDFKHSIVVGSSDRVEKLMKVIPYDPKQEKEDDCL